MVDLTRPFCSPSLALAQPKLTLSKAIAFELPWLELSPVLAEPNLNLSLAQVTSDSPDQHKRP